MSAKSKARCVAVLVTALVAAGPAVAGSLDPATVPGPTMHTLEEIYLKVENLVPQTLQTFSPTTTVIQAGYYAQTDLAVIAPALVSSNISAGATIFGVAGKSEVVDTASGNAAADDILAGKKAWVAGVEVTGSVPAGDNLTGANGSLVVPIADALYSGSKSATAGDTSLVTGNIKAGATIFGVAGKSSVVETAAGTASGSDLLVGKTAFANGTQITGTIVNTNLSADSTVVAAGYYAATNLTLVATGLAACNIATNVTLFGIAGALSTIPAAVPRTGQTNSCAANDDGAYQKGVTSPTPRFTVGTGATTNCVADNLTGLMWVKNPDATTRTWTNAITYCEGLDGNNGRGGFTDWRLPNEKELQSLVNFGTNSPPLTAGHPFLQIQNAYYWSSTSLSGATSSAWQVEFSYGQVSFGGKTPPFLVWPVRDAVDNRMPIASFTVNPDPAAPMQSITFNGTASYDQNPDRPIVSYQWNFGDGATATGASVTHAYTDFSTYTATLTVTDNNVPPRTSTITRSVFVSNLQWPVGRDGALVVSTNTTLAAGAANDYSSIDVQAGKTLSIVGNSGAIAFLGAVNGIVNNGMIEYRGIDSTGGTYTATSPDSAARSLSYTIIQNAGGQGGNGTTVNSAATAGNFSQFAGPQPPLAGGAGGSGAKGYGGGGGSGAGICGGVNYDLTGVGVAGGSNNGNGSPNAGWGNIGNTPGHAGTGGATGGAGANASGTNAGDGGGSGGAAGVHCLASEPARWCNVGGGGGGGMKGKHGGGLYLYTLGSITGTGTVDVSGSNGYNGGNGGNGTIQEYACASGGGGGGGGAGGSGGKLWIYALANSNTLNCAAGTGGTGGTYGSNQDWSASFGPGHAGGSGTNGVAGSVTTGLP